MLIVEMTVYQLDRSTHNAFGDDREHGAGKTSIGNIEYSEQQADGKTQLVVKSAVRGSTGMQYEPVIVFKNVTFEQEDTPQNITVQGSDGKDHHIDAASVRNSDVQVRCNCMDFYWRFANWNMKHKSLLGNPPPPYVKKTDRPPVNPTQKPGVCKHLYKLIQQIKAKRIM